MAVCHDNDTPSVKSLGKRPAQATTASSLPPKGRGKGKGTGSHYTNHNAMVVDDSVAMGTTPNPVQTRQKRILPSRSRRGGPGIGNCDTDVAILDVLKRQEETTPLIPSTSTFLLTTDAGLAPSSSSSGYKVNTYANERYFDRSEVIRAVRDQLEIQTPEFVLLTDESRIGRRLRVRGEEEIADTSDAVYERRHRKYEAFEKRQRVREKEKLMHEHYKLKERIDQLRGMDPPAFLSLSEEYFPSKPIRHDEDSDVPEFDPYIEGEKRQETVLEAAYTLERRYATLLERRGTSDKDRRTATAVQTNKTRSEPEEGDQPAEVIQPQKVANTSIRYETPPRKLPLVRLTVKSPTTTTSVPPALPQISDVPIIGRRKKRGRFGSSEEISMPEAVSQETAQDEERSLSQPPHYQPVADEESSIASTSREVLSTLQHETSIDASISASISISHFVERHSTRRADPDPAIIIAALRGKRIARSTMAFGVKMPDMHSLAVEFSLPKWLMQDEDEDSNDQHEDEVVPQIPVMDPTPEADRKPEVTIENNVVKRSPTPSEDDQNYNRERSAHAEPNDSQSIEEDQQLAESAPSRAVSPASPIPSSIPSPVALPEPAAVVAPTPVTIILRQGMHINLRETKILKPPSRSPTYSPVYGFNSHAHISAVRDESDDYDPLDLLDTSNR